MTDHISKSYPNGTKVDLYIQTPSPIWMKAIPILAFIALGLLAWSKAQTQQAAYAMPAVYSAPGTPWYFYVGIAAAVVVGMALILVGSLWLYSHLMGRKQNQKTYTVKLPKQEQQPEDQPQQEQAVAKVIPMKRRAS